MSTLVLIFFLGFVFSGSLAQVVRVNQAGLEVLHALVEQNPAKLQRFIDHWTGHQPQDCRLLWLSAVAIVGTQGVLASHQALVNAIHCQPEYLAALRGLAPYDVRLAEDMVRFYPRDTLALMWLAEIKERFDRGRASELYEIITQVDSTNGLAWCRLGGQRQNEGDLDRALDAFQKCCQHGDPGSNGCWRAGGILEKQGRLEEAIFWYSQSRFSEALKRARELQNRLDRSP